MGKWFIENFVTAVIGAAVAAIITLAVVRWVPSPGDEERKIHAKLHVGSKSLLKLIQPGAGMAFDPDMGGILIRIKKDASLQLIIAGTPKLRVNKIKRLIMGVQSSTIHSASKLAPRDA